MVTTETTYIDEALERLRAALSEGVTRQWLDDHKDDVVLAMEELGPYRTSQELGMSFESLKSWRRVRGLGKNGASPSKNGSTPAVEDLAGTVPLDQIDDNPWQPRKAMDSDALADLAKSIETSGLLQNPLGRRQDGRVQLAFGHRRVAAIRLLAESGKWEGGVPVAIKELSDHMMALIALEENVKRKDITQLEQLEAFQKVVDDGLMTVTELADSLGVNRSTLAHNLRILKLPKEALEYVASGDLKPSAARELLAFVAEDHTHEKEILQVLKDIVGRNDYYTRDGAPDWSIDSVKEKMNHQVTSRFAQEWRPFWKPDGHGFGGTGYSPPTFDLKDFSKEFPTHVHQIPRGKNGARAWTCNVREWKRRQTASTKAAGKAVSQAPKMGESDTAQYLQALKNDPVMLAIKAGEDVATEPVSAPPRPQAPEGEDDLKAAEYKKINRWVWNYLIHQEAEFQGVECDFVNSPSDCPGCSLDEDVSIQERLGNAEDIREWLDLDKLTDQQIESAVERALESYDDGDEDEGGNSVTAPAVPPSKLDDATKEKLGSRAGFLQRKGPTPAFKKELSKGYDTPRGFDIEECKEKCTWGAVYGQSQYGGTTLFCTNAKCYQDKVEAGKERFAKQVANRQKKDVEAEAQSIQTLRAAEPADQLRYVALALMAEQGNQRVQQYGNHFESDLWRERQATANVRRLLAIEKGRGSDMVSFRQNYRDIAVDVLEKVEKMDVQDLQELVVNLVAYSFGEHRVINVRDDVLNRDGEEDEDY